MKVSMNSFSHRPHQNSWMTCKRHSAMLSIHACCFQTRGNIFLALEPLWARETWRCNNRRRPLLAYTLSIFFRKGKLRHAPAKTWRGLRIPLFSLVPLSVSCSLPPTIPFARREWKSRGRRLYGVSVSAGRKDSRSSLGSSSLSSPSSLAIFRAWICAIWVFNTVSGFCFY